MTGASQRTALAALAAIRPTVARLDPSRDPEESAADLIEVWSAAEMALRSLLGGSALGGQALIREVRQRELLNIDQTHSLLDLLAVWDRVQSTDYLPTAADIATAREAMAKLDQALSRDRDREGTREERIVRPAVPASVLPASAPASVPGEDSAVIRDVRPKRAMPAALVIVIAVVAIAGVAAVGWWLMGRTDRQIAQGVRLYAGGQRQEAQRAFESVARGKPNLVLPHVYLGRIARENGDTAMARQELTTAVRVDPSSALAQRELASLALASGQLDLAARFYVRAIALDTADRAAKGWLSCALARQGRDAEATRWLARAGPGAWSACASSPAPSPAPTVGAPLPPS